MLFVALYTQQCVIADEKTGWNILRLYCHLQNVKVKKKSHVMSDFQSLQIDEKKRKRDFL